MRDSNSSISAGGKPSGNVGNGRSSTRPAISQCPVTESLPGEASAMRPKAARGRSTGGIPGSVAMFPSPSAWSVGTLSTACRLMLPSVSLPSSPYERRVGQLADADAVEDDDEGALENRHQDGRGAGRRDQLCVK